jgi:hypothetical protein
MAKKPEDDRIPVHKRRILIRPRTFESLQRLAMRDEVEISELVNRAIRELLQREGEWPPKEDGEKG